MLIANKAIPIFGKICEISDLLSAQTYTAEKRILIANYTLSHLENECDVSAYSGGRLLSSRAQLVRFLTCSKKNTGIDA